MDSSTNAYRARPAHGGPGTVTSRSLETAARTGTAGRGLLRAPRGALLTWRRLRRPLFLFGLYLSGFATPAVAFVLAYTLRFETIPDAASLVEVLERPSIQFTLGVVMFAYVFLMRQAGLYGLHRTWLPFDYVLRLVFVCTVSMLLLPLVGRAQPVFLGSRIFLVYFGMLLIILSVVEMLAARIVVLLMLCFGIGVKKVVLVGATEATKRLLKTLQEHPQLGYHVIGVLMRNVDPTVAAESKPVKTTTGPARHVMGRMLALNPDVLILTRSPHQSEDLLNLVGECTASGVDVRLVPEFSEVFSRNLVSDCVGITPLVHLRPLRAPVASAAGKRVIDILLAMCLLPFLVVAVIALVPRARRPRAPILGRKTRIGIDGRRFEMRLFNPSLWPSSEPGATVTAGSGEASLWRAALPQVINVLRGEMSLVGPRPGDPERVAHYTSWEKRALAARPGAFGVNVFRAAVSPDARAAQMNWDIAYVDQRSAAFDLSVLLAALSTLLPWRGTARRNPG